MVKIPDPTFVWFELLPVLVVLGVACIGMLIEALAPRKVRLNLQIVVTLTGLAAAIAATVWVWLTQLNKPLTLPTDPTSSFIPPVPIGGPVAMGAVMVDGPALLVWLALLVFGLLAIMVFAERSLNGGVTAFAASASATPGSATETEAVAQKREHSEVFPLALFSLAGMMVFASANELLTMFIALEVMSLPLYLLSGMARRRRLLSQEAALKYFLLGAFASAFFLFGMALIYGYSGKFDLGGIAESLATSTMNRGVLLAGIGLLAVGLLFKVGAVPFQSWVPDVYTGSPTPVTGFMAICTKLAAVIGLARVFFVSFGAERWSWQPVLAIVAICTMIIGVFLALTQSDIKRLLAYSAISHAGFILTAVVGANQDVTGQVNALGSIIFYLIAYGFGTIAAFAIIQTVRDKAGEATSLDSWAGLGRKNPLLAGIFTFLLLSFAGIPLTGGFIGKWAVFASAWAGGFSWLAITAVVFSLIAAYFYIRVIVVMFFRNPVAGVSIGKASLAIWIPVGIGAIATAYLGLFPGQLLDLITSVQVFLR